MLYILIFLLVLIILYVFLSYSSKKKHITTHIKSKKEYNCSISKSEKWGAFCINKEHPYIGFNNVLDSSLAEAIGITFVNYTIIDLGAGLGQYCRVINKYTTCHPYDGSKNIEIVTNGSVKFLNLAESIEIDCVHDIVMSIEVGEHIPKEFENIYIENLIKCSKNIIIITWARKGQGGFYHVNEKDRNEVIRIFLSKGLKWEESVYNKLHKRCELMYIKNNLMVFKK